MRGDLVGRQNADQAPGIEGEVQVGTVAEEERHGAAPKSKVKRKKSIVRKRGVGGATKARRHQGGWEWFTDGLQMND